MAKSRKASKRKCGGCGQKGHGSNECTKHNTWICKNCAESGHGHWECPKPHGYLRIPCPHCAQVGNHTERCRNKSIIKCTNCKQTGHTHTTCSKPTGYDQRLKCGLCRNNGHHRNACPARQCAQCYLFGHDMASCPSGLQANAINCESCGEEEHFRPRFSKSWEARNNKPDPTATYSWYPDNGESTTGYAPRWYSESVESDNDQETPVVPLAARARAACATENFALAVSLFAQAIASDPHVASHYTERGIAYAQSKKYACAIGDFQTASSKADYIPSPLISFWTAKCRFYLGSHASALFAVRDVLSLDPDYTDALALKRRLVELQKHIESYHAARKRQHWKLARAAYESCLGIYSEEDCDLPVDIRCWNVELRMAEADWKSVVSSVERLMHKEPKSTEVMLLRARVLLLTAKLTDALAQTMTVLKLDPDDANAKEIRTRLKGIIRSQSEGGVHFRHGRWIDAIREWDEALHLVGDKAEEGNGGIIRATLLRGKAEAELNIGNYSDGIKHVNIALELDATYAEALLTRARINVSLELYDVAVEGFRAALQLGKLTMPVLVLSSVQEELDAAEQKAINERNKEKDYYKILGLQEDCTMAQIRKAYHLESLKHHPDKGGIEEKFKLVVEAYTTLSDADSRDAYDFKLARSRATMNNPPDYTDYDYEGNYEEFGSTARDRGWWR